MADDDWASLQAASKSASAAVSAILSNGTAGSRNRAAAAPTAVRDARAWRSAPSSLDKLLGVSDERAAPLAPTATASALLTRSAAAAKPRAVTPLPLLTSFTTAAAAAAAYARDISALSDEALEVRADAAARLCSAICGCSWAAQRNGAADVDFSVPAELTLTSHRPAAADASRAHGFLGAVPSAPLALDLAFGYSAREVSDVAALLLGRSSSAGAMGPIDQLCALGAAAAGCEIGATTRSLAFSLAQQHPDICFDGCDAGSSIPRRVAQAPDSDDEEDGLKEKAPESEPPASAPEDPSTRGLSRADMFAELWVTNLLKPVLRRLDDPCEAVRVCALRLTATALASLRDVTSTLPLLLPLLLSRVNSADWTFDEQQKIFARGSEAIAALHRGRVLPGFGAAQSVLSSPTIRTDANAGEPSEAARASCVALLTALLRGAVAHGGLAAVTPWVAHVIVAAHALCADNAPPVRSAAAVLMVQLVALFPSAVKHFAVALARGVLPGLRARAAVVRLAAIDVFDALVHCADDAKGRGAGSEALLTLLGARDAHSIPIATFYEGESSTNYAAALALDGNAAVRLRWTAAIGGWSTRLPDRHEWWPHLMPYLLSCLTDETGGDDANALPPARAALVYIEALGAAHEIEHAKVLIERVQYGVDAAGDAETDGPLPAPFTERPRLGARLFVRSQGRRVLPPLLRELREWESFGGAYASGRAGARARAAALLAALLVFYEEAATQDSADLAGALAASLEPEDSTAKTASDADAVASSLRAATRVAGRFLAPTAWLALLSALASCSQGATRTRGQSGLPSRAEQAGALTALALTLGELTRRPHRVDAEALMSLADTMMSADTWAATQACGDGLEMSSRSAAAAAVFDASINGFAGEEHREKRPQGGAKDFAGIALERLRSNVSSDVISAAARTLHARSRRALAACAFHSARIVRARAGAAAAICSKLILVALAIRGATLCDAYVHADYRGSLESAALGTAVLEGVWPGAESRAVVTAPCGFADGAAPPLALADSVLVAALIAVRGGDVFANENVQARDAVPSSFDAIAALLSQAAGKARGHARNGGHL
jgi:trimeric autotransporter adhesin